MQAEHDPDGVGVAEVSAALDVRVEDRPRQRDSPVREAHDITLGELCGDVVRHPVVELPERHASQRDRTTHARRQRIPIGQHGTPVQCDLAGKPGRRARRLLCNRRAAGGTARLGAREGEPPAGANQQSLHHPHIAGDQVPHHALDEVGSGSLPSTSPAAV